MSIEPTPYEKKKRTAPMSTRSTSARCTRSLHVIRVDNPSRCNTCVRLVRDDFHVSSSQTERSRSSTVNTIVSASPLLNRSMSSFLHVYSQAASSHDVLLHWSLFSSSELESFDVMLTRLYKDENLSRVQSYENYRMALSALLTTARTSSAKDETDDDDNLITTTAL
jgi:hypothetical protein